MFNDNFYSNTAAQCKPLKYEADTSQEKPHCQLDDDSTQYNLGWIYLGLDNQDYLNAPVSCCIGLHRSDVAPY